MQAEDARETHPEGRRAVERDGKEGAADADTDLEPSVDGNEAPELRHRARSQQGAQSKSAHERRQDGRRRVHRVAEHEAEEAKPDHLVDEPGGAREKEAKNDDAGSGRDLVAIGAHAATIA